MRSPDGWSVVAALAEADAQLAYAQDLRRVAELRAAFLAAQRAEASLNAIRGRFLGMALPEVASEALALVLEHADVVADQLTILCAGTEPDESRLDVATRILRTCRYSGAEVLRALKRTHAGKSARNLPAGEKRKAERLGIERASKLKRELPVLQRAHSAAIAAGAKRLPKEASKEPVTESTIGGHLLAMRAEGLARRIAEHQATIRAIECPAMAARTPHGGERNAAELERIEKKRLTGSDE